MNIVKKSNSDKLDSVILRKTMEEIEKDWADGP
jgi:hypothetical protein